MGVLRVLTVDSARTLGFLSICDRFQNSSSLPIQTRQYSDEGDEKDSPDYDGREAKNFAFMVEFDLVDRLLYGFYRRRCISADVQLFKVFIHFLEGIPE